MNLSRSSGILLHVTSLPGGRLGPHAYAFVDWLAAAGQPGGAPAGGVVKNVCQVMNCP